MGNPSTGKRKRRSWEESYEDLKAYHARNGHCNVPLSTPVLGKWVHRNRHERKRYLTPEQRAKLDALNFDWESAAEKNERAWIEMYERLKRYKREHRDCHVPQKKTYEGTSLGLWVSAQRTLYKNNKLKSDRKEKLEEIGFLWIYDENLVWKEGRNRDKLDEAWNHKFELLQAYRREKGHCFVPPGFIMLDDKKNKHDLGKWVVEQRMIYRDGLLRQERKQQLESLEFVWKVDHFDANASLNQQHWNEMFGRLLEFKRNRGHCRVPFSYQDEDGATLGRWADVQRTRYSTGTLDEKRSERLQTLGFEFYFDEDRWNSMYQHLKVYKTKHGHCNVPHKYTTADGVRLGSWVLQQRCTFKKHGRVGALQERAKRLDDLGFVFEGERQQRWEIGFERLKEFKEVHGHCRVPTNYDDGKGPSLSGFVSDQRRRRREKALEKERVRRLDSISFPWKASMVRPKEP